MTISQEEYLNNRKIIIEPYLLLDGSDFYHKFSGLKFDKSIIINAIKTYFEKWYEMHTIIEDHDDEDVTDLVLNHITVFDCSDLKTIIRRYETIKEYNFRMSNGNLNSEEDICNPYGLEYNLEKEVNPITFAFDIFNSSFIISDDLIKKYFEKIEFTDIVNNAEPFFDELNEIVINNYTTKTKHLYFHLEVYSDGTIRISKNLY